MEHNQKIICALASSSQKGLAMMQEAVSFG